MKPRFLSAVAFAFVGLVQLGCGERTPFGKTFQPCFKDDRFGPNITQFGASNNSGAGSLFRARPEGGFDLFFSRLSVDTPPTKFPPNAVNVNPDAQCSASDAQSVKVNANFSLTTSAIKGISADLSAAINHATTIKIDPTKFSVEELEMGPFIQYVQGLPNDNLYKKSLTQKGFLLMVRAVRVEGLHATLTFSKDDTFDVKGTFSPTGAGTIASAKAGLSAEAKDDKTLELTSTAPFYIAGELATFNSPGGGTGLTSALRPIDNSKEMHP